jgi:peroxiredoxin
MPLNSPAPEFDLPGIDGKTYNLDSFSEADALIVVFTCNHCPYSKASEDKLIDIQNRYRDKGVQIVAINPNDAENYPEDSFENMTKRAEEKGFNFPYLHDESQEIAHKYNAACTPDVFVFDKTRRLKYNGRIDDNWKEADKVTRKDLELALEDILADRFVSFDAIPAMGCSIKWKQT